MLKGTRRRRFTAQGQSFAICLVVVYMWWIVATPQNAPRLKLLTKIHFERIIAIVLAMTLALDKQVRPPAGRIAWPLTLFYLAMCVSYFISPYGSEGGATYWFHHYWKVFLFFAFVAMSVRNINDLTLLIKAFVVISVVYQLHSWKDFLAGGSYVWQQGMRRMCGVWADPGLGAPNAFGSLALSTIPFVLAWGLMTPSKRGRVLLVLATVLCLLSILYSGTRGAFLVLAGLIVFMIGPSFFRPKVLVTVTCLGLLTFMLMPQDLKDRYFGTIFGSEDEIATGVERVQQRSAQARIDGLVDGYNLFLKRPIFGYGPGTSAVARLEVSSKGLIEGDETGTESLQLHNMYGQLISEGGLLATIPFLLAIWAVFSASIKGGWGVGRTGEDRRYRACALLVRNSLVVLLGYALISHSLYDHEWTLFFGISAAYLYVESQRSAPIIARLQ